MPKVVIHILIFVMFNSYAQDQNYSSKENFLKSIDLDKAQFGFKKLDGSTPANWEIKYNGYSIANLKCTQKNTFHVAAIVTYELGKILKFNRYPVAIPIKINRSISFHYYQDGKIIEEKRFVKEECALKEWIINYAPYYWIIDEKRNKNSFIKSSKSKIDLVKSLNCKNKMPKKNEHSYYSLSSRGDKHNKNERHSRIYYIGTTKFINAAKDFSNLMVMDAILGNEDRFPGGNLHFHSQTDISFFKKNRVIIDSPQIFSMDNESSLRGDDKKAIQILGQYISRFDKDFIQRIRNLHSNLIEIDTNRPLPKKFWFLKNRSRNTKEPIVQVLIKNIENVLEVVDKAESQCEANSSYF